ncbi:putative RNA methyltransferase [Hibiscus syriacus]|uniref:RNA methyltransferase n=1 Tax=Hibiscus syriacus TaxID=106335 RepID=A0A6A2Z8S6_HIBSY|nr:probable RNA methyltransferase At5g51130 [Hibiscus syriacus]KAE8687532.1 putative RNA methyltransferase [Hibiscus syriacus]
MAEINEKKRNNRKQKRKQQDGEADKEGRNGNNREATKRSVETQAKSNPYKKIKKVFPYGNYRHYYGYRIGRDAEREEDPRIRVLKKEWFEGKDCLDIGCNSGIITIQIAKKYNCGSILGIDIDSGLVQEAIWHLRKFVKTESAEKKNTNGSNVKVVQDVNGSEECATKSSNEGSSNNPNHNSSGERNLSDIVSFREENFVWSQLPDKQYDTVLCLSVTKWIHLNWGDDGLITAFSKIWRLLRPGGVFVLEPQPWNSYEKNRKVSETTASNYHDIKYRPDSFREILLDKIGFRKVEDLTSELSGTKAGFDRPILAYYK